MRIARLTIAIVLASLLASCAMRVERDPAVIVQHLGADPSVLNPITSTDAYASDVLSYIYESLLDRDRETLKLKPMLAERWTIADDHLTYTFTLREGVKWHDGAPFTVDDVVYSFERINDPNVDAAHYRNYFRDIKKVEKLDARTVRFTYSKPYFRALEICGSMPIVPKHLFDDGTDFNAHRLNRAPVGTGPYRFKEWVTGSRIELTRNEDYWGTKPTLSGIVYKIIPDSTVAFQLLKKGALDLSDLRAIQWERQTESARFDEMFEKYRYFMPNYSYIGWNMRRPFFEDRRVRLAMTMLVNREDILKKLLFGQGAIVTGNLYRFGPMYDERIAPWPYDPAEAKRLLDEAGWSDHDGDGWRDKDGLAFDFNFLVPAGSKFAQSIGLILREELERVGIRMNIQQLEWAAMLKILEDRSFDATSLAWSSPLEDDPYQVWHSTQAVKGSNFIGFINPEADKILEDARREFDPDKRALLFHRFQRILHEEQPYTFLFTNPSLVAVARRFTNVVAYKIGLDPLKWGVGPWNTLMEW